MTRNLPPDLLTRARQILLPLVATAGEREALLTEAFYLHDPLLYAIERDGAPKVFLVNCLKKLLDYGPLPDGEHSLARLLRTAQYGCGVDKHAEIDELVNIANALCQPASPVPRPAIATAPVESPAPIQTIDTPRDERRPTVFISYFRGDKKAAHRLIADLTAAGHACWIDTSAIKGGDEWVLTIADGIINSYALVAVITLDALNSKWVQKEILWAQSRKKLIIPWILEDVMHERGYFPLVDCQGVTLFDREYDGALEILLRSLPGPILPEVESKDTTPDTSVETISISKPRGAPRKLELAYLERLRLEELLNTEKYTPMGGTSEQRLPRAEMRAVFELLPMTKDHHLRLEPRRFENAVDEIRRIRRAVLLGEPGGGKTTTIWKLAAELVADALNDRKAPIPLLIRLGRWTDADQPLPAFIASQLDDLSDSLDQLLDKERAALLLDGLNELPVGQREAKYPQVQRFIKQHHALLAVVSCRELDYTLDLGFNRINITPLDPPRIREFAGRYLGADQGEALFWKLAGQAAQNTHEQYLRELGSEPTKPQRVFWPEWQLPEKISQRWWGQSWNWLKLQETPSSLMVLARNPYMLLMLTSVYAERGELPENRGELFQLFVETLLNRERIPESEQTPLTEGLGKVAYKMQRRRAPVGEDKADDALTVLPKADVNAILGERLLYLAGSASILNVGQQVRFTHQLLQEYFAARYMHLEIRAGRLKALDIWLPNRWWQRTNWEEAAILLAGLYGSDCSRIVEWVAKANPEVAAMCVLRSGAGLAEATAEGLRSRWIPRLTDLKRDPDPKARATVGQALGMTGWDNRKGVGIVRDGRGVALPDIDWVKIPDGEFQYGEKKQKLTLLGFHISRYPVTFAQFQTFLDDPEGYANPQWFEGLAASDYGRRVDEQYFKFATHPRESVNWNQAMAFCRWFSWRLGGSFDLKKVVEWAVRLPTEYEWEKAARGTDGRSYPYQGDFDAAMGNTRATGIGQTSAVGIFPNGASPYGVMDMSGNVFEWCLSSYINPAPDAQRECVHTNVDRVLRGGSWSSFLMSTRAVFRDFNNPAYRYNYLGFRLVCVVRPPSLKGFSDH